MSQGKTRTRVMLTPNPLGNAVSIPLGYYQNYNSTTKLWGNPTGHQVTTFGSLGYPGIMGKSTRDETHVGPPYLSGGPFRSLRLASCTPFAAVQGRATYYRLDGLKRYVGGFTMPNTSDWQAGMNIGPFSTTVNLSSSEFPALGDWGNKGFIKCSPKLEQASGFVALAEGADLPRMLGTTAKGFHQGWRALGGNQIKDTMSPKNVADHFLNNQFGWIPFLSDVSKFMDNFRHSYRKIGLLADQNGKWVRRRVTLSDTSTTQMLNSGTGVQLFPNTSFDSPFGPQWFSAGNPARWELHEEVHHLITASGKFRFYRPEFDRSKGDYMSLMNRVGRQMTLYGARISPANIYKATPWSWAGDWISNAGDYVQRANDMLVDSVAAQYLYVMQHRIRIRRYIQYIPFSTGTVKLEFVREIETKQRDEGLSPYGFSLSPGDLTGRQLAIAGALGITRL